MSEQDPKRILSTLNSTVLKAFERAIALAVSRRHDVVTTEHLLLKLAEDPDNDVARMMESAEVPPGELIREINRCLDNLSPVSSEKPSRSPRMMSLLHEAWMISSLELGEAKIRSGSIVIALALGHGQSQIAETDVFKRFNAARLKANFGLITHGSAEGPAVAGPAKTAGKETKGGRSPESALAQFTTDFTAQARAGDIDPVFEREKEIRQLIDILARRRKNNPIIVGEAGVGKTALIEGLALRIVQNDVPDFIKNADLLSLDMGLLQAGAGVKGEFENRLKNVLNEVKASPKPIILFIDEAHTVIGAGGSAGGSDAANLLKPALARGELRTIAATTWSEYKKYFERDPALARRFQVVKCDEPSEEGAAAMLRGLRPKYEEAHQVRILDQALVAAARLSNRYISGRQLPDKAVDLLDTAAARVKVSLTTKPHELDDIERRVITLTREIESRQRDAAAGARQDPETIPALEAQVAGLLEKGEDVTRRWEAQRAIATEVLELEARLNGEGGEAASDGASKPELEAQYRDKLAELAEAQGREPLVQVHVNTETVAKVVADWTGIPVGKMVRDEAAVFLRIEDDLKTRIQGQDHALEVISKGLRAAKAGLGNPSAPMGVFLLVGASGVGKTETALSVADLLFGGERFIVTINMSEFQEKHTVSRLVGSPPGYVGYGEGGVLTEAVRQRPYSVVLLDECEKAHLDVMNIFYQVFDKGMLADGEGRVIDFKNTVIFLTSNLATDEIMALAGGAAPVSPEELASHIRPVLSKHFKPALLARMTVVPYFPLRGEAMERIVKLKLDRLAAQIQTQHRMRFTYAPEIVVQIADRCNEVETGARNIDHIIRGSLLPRISGFILERLADETLPPGLHLALDENGEFDLIFEAPEREAAAAAAGASIGAD